MAVENLQTYMRWVHWKGLKERFFSLFPSWPSKVFEVCCFLAPQQQFLVYTVPNSPGFNGKISPVQTTQSGLLQLNLAYIVSPNMATTYGGEKGFIKLIEREKKSPTLKEKEKKVFLIIDFKKSGCRKREKYSINGISLLLCIFFLD